MLNNCPLLNRVIVNGDSTWTDPASLANLVYSLCDSTESHVLNNVAQACIEGSGTRAAAIIGHASNDCNLAACLPSCPSSSSAITIPDGTESIPLAQYFECVTITSVTFNTDGLLKKIDNYAFEQADGLTEVMIPSSVTSIGTTAFYSCDELVQAVFDTTSESSELRFIGPVSNPPSPLLLLFFLCSASLLLVFFLFIFFSTPSHTTPSSRSLRFPSRSQRSGRELSTCAPR